VQPIVDAGLAELVETDHVLVDSGSTRVYLRPTPGHTPGHASLVVESSGASAIVTGDCIHHPLQLTELALCSVADTDRAEATKTRERLLSELCDSPTLVFGTHFARPTCGLVRRNDRGYWLDTTTAARAEAESDNAKL